MFMAVPSGNGVYAAASDPANTGTGVLDPGTVTDLSAWVPDSYTVDFLTATTWEVRDGGGALVTSGTYTPRDPIAFSGIEIAIDGAPAAGDRFTVDPSTARSIFDVVDDLAASLRAPVVAPADGATLANSLTGALADLDQALGNVDSVRARIGARLNAVDSERSVNEGFEIHLQEVRSEIGDLDYAEAISRLSQQSAALQAAQASFARIQGLTLFDYLR